MSAAHDDPDSWRLRTDNNIPFRVIERSGSFEIESASASETYLLQASDLLAFIEETFPAPIPVGGQLRYPITRLMPGFPQMFTQNVTWKAQIDGKPIDPFGTDPNAIDKTYGSLINLTIQYKTGKNREDPEDPKTFLEISSTATGEFLHTTAPKGKWEDDDQVADPAIPALITVPETQWSVRWPRIPWSFFRGQLIERMRSKLGKVNSDAVEVLFGAAPETLLFAGYGYSESYTWREGLVDTPPISIDMKFVEKRIEDAVGNIFGHQHVWRPGAGWNRLLFDGVNRLYEEVTMSDLFRPPVDEEPEIPPEELKELQKEIALAGAQG